jgi:hypothetical protein
MLYGLIPSALTQAYSTSLCLYLTLKKYTVRASINDGRILEGAPCDAVGAKAS